MKFKINETYVCREVIESAINEKDCWFVVDVITGELIYAALNGQMCEVVASRHPNVCVVGMLYK